MKDLDPAMVAAIDIEPVAATLHRDDGRWQLRMTRLLAHPVERVWTMLTDPAQLARWSPVVPDRPLDRVGPATSHEAPDAPEVATDVLVCDPPSELVHRWGEHLLRWTVRPDAAGGSRLTLQQTFDDRSEAATYGAGWHLCLAVLSALSRGGHPERAVGERAVDYGWRDLRAHYEAYLDTTTTLSTSPTMTTALVIRRPATEVFEAFVDPDITSRIWFSTSTGRLEHGAAVEWTWDARPDCPAQVVVTDLVPGERIGIDWSGPGDVPTHVEWRFDPAGDDRTRVVITETGFTAEDGDAVVVRALDSTGGFTMVLVAMKALLEHDIVLDVVGSA